MAVTAAKEMKVCQKCGKLMDVETQFYKRKDGSHPDLCKKCLTMHIDNFNPDTFLWLLEDMDVPYIEEEWNVLRNRAFEKNPNLTGMSVFGKYLSKMKLRQWKDYGWKDTERLQAERAQKRSIEKEAREAYEADLKIQFENGEINESQYKTLMSVETQNRDYIPAAVPEVDNPFNENNFMPESEMPKLDVDLTPEEISRLAIKWGRLYKPSEWVELEKNYTEMTRSFDIQDADTINTLILLCKTNLKMNQAIDCGDVEGFQKLSKVSESLRKSAKFTAAQNKEEKDEFVDCVGNLVAYCEKEGGKIPKYEITTPLDIIDKVIDDLKTYTRTLIYEDKALAKQIEDYLKRIEISKQQKADKELAKKMGYDDVQLEDKDYQNYFEDIENQKQEDAQVWESTGDEDDFDRSA